MLRLNITSKDGGKYWLEVSSRQEADAYKEQVKQSAHWGKPAWTETIVTPAILDEAGNVVSPEVTETKEHAAEYSIVEEDMSAELEAKKLKKDEIELAQKDFEKLVSKSTATTAELLKGLKDLAKLLAK